MQHLDSRRSFLSTLPLAALCLLSWASLPASAITIGAGPVLTNQLGATTDKKGTTWYEEFQDWTSGDLRQLDQNADAWVFGDGHDPARDLVAFYHREEGGILYFRADFFDMQFGSENNNLDLYVAIDCAAGGTEFFPDFTDTRADSNHFWELCIGLYNNGAATVYDDGYNPVSGVWQGSYWNSQLDSVEFGISRQALLDAGWDGTSTLHFQVFTTRDGTNGGAGELTDMSDIADAFGTVTRDVGDGTGRLTGAIASDASTGRAKYAVIAHANQSVATKTGTQNHIYTDDGNHHPGFVRLLDSAEMFKTPVNLHISGTLLMSFLWATQDPSDPGYPDRDGPTFVSRVSSFVTNGPGSLIGGVLAEHIMPYFEGEVNRKSIEQNNLLLEHLFDLTPSDMQVMHVPERVIRSNTNHPHVQAEGPLDGKTFADIADSGFSATYLDEVTHLHWWFYPDEQFNAGWDTNNCGRWAGGQGNDEEPYHHKVHRINGVYSFMINDREDQAKFGNDDGGMLHDTRYALLDKALQGDSAQLTLVFDDWEAFAGNSFASADPNNNAGQFHNTLRWAANHQWIDIVNLRTVLGWATNDPAWVVDHGMVDDKSSQTYEWLKRASEHSYDNWYYGGDLEESFYDRVPVVHWSTNAWTPAGMKPYGDLNTPGTLIHDSWAAIQQISATNLRRIAEWSYSAMIYETAWHDEDANPDQYKSRNYQDLSQGGFNRGPAEGNCDTSVADTTWDPISGWAVRLHGHVRDMGVLKEADDWVQDIKNGVQGPATLAYAVDADDDTLDEYILCNNRVFLCFERWGARLIKAFVYDPHYNGGDARMVIGAPVTNPAEEHENEGADNNRCSAFKDRYNSGLDGFHYVDMDFAETAPAALSNGWAFVSRDGRIQKTVTLDSGRDVARAAYTLTPDVGTLYTRFGLGPNQFDLMLNGPAHLGADGDLSYRGLTNRMGGAAFVVAGQNCSFVNGAIANAGWEARELPLVEQFEVFTTGTNVTMALAFSADSAKDLDGDGLSNTNEFALGTDHEKADSDGDSIADGYEVAEGLNPGSDDAQADEDRDGMSNLAEYRANTRAGSSGSVFRIEAINPRAGGLDIRHTTAPDRDYRILYAEGSGLGTGLVWKPFTSQGEWSETAGVESVHTFHDDFSGAVSEPNAGPARFYRIRVEQN